MNFGENHDRLVKKLAELRAHQAEVHQGQDELAKHAREQADTMPRAIQTAASYQDSAGILAHRRHRTLARERRRLEQIGHDHDRRRRARD